MDNHGHRGLREYGPGYFFLALADLPAVAFSAPGFPMPVALLPASAAPVTAPVAAPAAAPARTAFKAFLALVNKPPADFFAGDFRPDAFFAPDAFPDAFLAEEVLFRAPDLLAAGFFLVVTDFPFG